MPTLQLHLAPTQSPEREAALAASLTDLAARVLGKRPEVTAVLVQSVPRWFIGGRGVDLPTALLEIDITAGTNTAQQKADFVEAAHEALRLQLGPLAPASYVIVRELPAGDWGYGGQTQRARQLARERLNA
jgi:4-oxalocrotonate tautomerase